METLMDDPLIEELKSPGTHPHEWISPIGPPPYPPPSLSLISPMWGPLGNYLGRAPPCTWDAHGAV